MIQVKVTVSYIVELDPKNAEHYDYPESRVSSDQTDNEKVSNMALEDVEAVNLGQMLFNEQSLGSGLKVVSVEVPEIEGNESDDEEYSPVDGPEWGVEDISGPRQDVEYEQRKAMQADFDAPIDWEQRKADFLASEQDATNGWGYSPFMED